MVCWSRATGGRLPETLLFTIEPIRCWRSTGVLLWGSPAVRGILYYENTWGKKPLQKIDQDEAVVVALRALDTASEADTATGGIDRHAKIFPVMKIVSADGILTLPEEKIAELFHKRVA